MFGFTALDAYKMLFMLELLASEFLYTFRLKKRRRFVPRFCAACAVCFVLTFFYPVLRFDAIFTSVMFLCLFLLTIFALWLCYDEPLVNIVFCGIAAYTTRHLAFQLYNLVGSILDGADFAVNGMYGSDVMKWDIFDLKTLFHAFVYVDCFFFVYALMLGIFGRQLWKNKDLKLKNVSMLVLVGFVLLIDILINAVAVYNSVDDFLNTLLLYSYNILCCLLTLYMQFSMIGMKKLRKDLDVVNHLWQQDREQYEIAKENIDLINLKCHDLKYQIRRMGQRDAVGAGQLQEIEKMISIYDSTVKTGNEALDVILTEKSLVCRKNSISLTCMADGAKMGFMDDTDIYALFGNLVDNATEAVRTLGDVERRIIGLTVHAEDFLLLINVNNYYDGVIVLDAGGLPVTTKRNKDYHGFGMKSMRLIVEKYGGDLTIDTENGVFNVDIVVPIPEDPVAGRTNA